MKRLAVTWVLVATLLAAGGAEQGHAAMVSVDAVINVCDPSAGCGPEVNDYLIYKAAPGEANVVTVRALDRKRTLVEEVGAPLVPGSGCRTTSPTTAICRVELHSGDENASSEVELGDGNDSLTWTGLDASIDAGEDDDVVSVAEGQFNFKDGPGGDHLKAGMSAQGYFSYERRTAPVRATLDGVADDGESGEGDNLEGNYLVIQGGSAGDTISGGAGPTGLYGLDGDDTLIGGAGVNTLLGGKGADVMRGGGGRATVNYSGSSRGVTVTLGDGPNDGAPGESDDVADVEDLSGSRFADQLTGDDGPNQIEGGAGRDHVAGAGGADRLYDGYDSSGSDRARDLVIGGAGSDRLTLGDGDRGDSNDQEADRIRCGESGPALAWDPLDRFIECAPLPVLLSRRVSGRHPSAFVRLRCPRRTAVACRGRVSVREDGSLLGRRGYGPMPAGAERRLPIRLKRPAWRRATLILDGLRRVPRSTSTYRVTAPARH